MWETARQRIAEFRRGEAKYLPKERLACGGMAEIWRGEAHFQDGLVIPVAIKRVLPDLADQPVYSRMLQDEARIGMMLRHPNIVRVFDARMVNGSFVMVMELVDGASLRETLRQLQRTHSVVPLAAALHIAREVARALEFAHEVHDEWGRPLCVVHRDVSPHNVLLSRTGDVKLMDFGLAQSSANELAQTRGSLGGKLAYLAPEVVLGQEVGPAADLFALGVVLWECLTGGRLFLGPNEDQTVRRVVRCQVPAIAPMGLGVPAEVDQLLSTLLAREPDARHASAADLGAELEYLLLRYGRGGGAAEAAQLLHGLGNRRSLTVPGESSSRSVSRSGAQPKAEVLPNARVPKRR